MNRLQLAQRGYRRIVPEPVTRWTDRTLREVMVWLTDVCSIVEDYVKRPAFREHATWPLQALAPGANSPERKLIEAVDSGFVTEAELLVSIARQRPVRKVLAAANPPRKRLIEEAVLVGGGASERVGAKVGPVDELAIETAQVEGIAHRFWRDLVCPEDYFEPRGGWMLRQPDAGHRQAWEFIVAFNPELHPMGNFVSRCLLRRVDEIFDTLRTFARKCFVAARSSGRNPSREFEAEQECWQQLTADMRSLRKALTTTSDVGLRDSCVILTQAYAAFDPAPELSWLGLRPEVVASGVAALHHRLTRSRAGAKMTDRIAAALGELSRLYHNDSHEQARIEEAVATGGLVVIENRREAYWQRQRIDAAWHTNTRHWELLVQFASKGRHQAPVSLRDLEATGTSSSQLPVAVNRLKATLPPSLSKMIEAIRGEGTYRLNLERNRVHLF